MAWRLMLQEFQQHRWKAKEAISCYTVNSISSAKELDVALPRSPSNIKQSIYQQSCKFIVWSWSYLTPKTTFPFLLKKNFYNIFYPHFSFPIQLYACSISLLSLLPFCSPQKVINKKERYTQKVPKAKWDQKPTQLPLSLCWPTTLEHEAHPEVWFNIPMRLHRRNQTFPLTTGISCRQIFGWLGMGPCVHVCLSALDLHLVWVCVCLYILP